MHFDLKGFISCCFNFSIYLWILINLLGFHLDEFRSFHFMFDSLEDSYLPMGFRLYWFQEKEGYYFKEFKSEDLNSIFDSNFIINNYPWYFLDCDYLSWEMETLPYCLLTSELSGVQETCPMNGKCLIRISIFKLDV